MTPSPPLRGPVGDIGVSNPWSRRCGSAGSTACGARWGTRRTPSASPPRKRGSHWSNVNIAMAKRLAKEGRMAPAGLAAFKALDPRRTGQGGYAQDKPMPLPSAFLRRLKADPKAWATFHARPPGYRRNVAWWIASAKRPETQERRFSRLFEACRQGLMLDWAGTPKKPARSRTTPK